MAEFIRIAEYCTISKINKSKVYRAINSGIIKTKKIDGVKYIDLDELPDAFKVDPVTRHELDTSLKAVDKSQPGKPSGQVSEDHLLFFKSFCEQLEQKTSIALASQEDTIKMLKNELQRKEDEVVKLEALPSGLSESALKELEERESRIIQLEKDFSERIESITSLEESFIKLQERILELESPSTEDGKVVVKELVDTEKVEQLESELVETKEKLENALKELDEKAGQIQDLAIPESERELKSKLNEQKKLVKNLELSIKKKQEKIFDLESEVKELSQKMKELEKQPKEASQQVYDFENIPDSYQDEMKRLETEIDVKQSKIMKLEKELKEYKYNIPELEKESIDVQLRFSYLLNEIEDLKNSVTVQEKRLKEKDKIIASNQKLLKGQTDDTIDVERIIQDKQEKVEALEKDLFEKDQKIVELEKLLVGDKPDSQFFDGFSDEGDAFGDMVPGFGDEERPSAKEQIEELQKTIKDKEEIIAKLEGMLKDVEKGTHSASPILDLPFDESQIVNKIEDEEVKGLVSAKFSKILDLQTLLSEKDDYVKDLEEKQKSYEADSLEEHRAKNDLIEKLESIIDEKENEINELKESAPEIGSRETTTDDLVQVLEAKLQEKDHYISELEGKLEQEFSDDEDNEAQIKIESLEKELQEKLDYILALEKEVNADDESSADDDAKQIIQEQLDTIESLEIQLKEKDEVISNLEEELSQKEQSVVDGEESPLETLYGGYEELSTGVSADLYMDESEEVVEISSSEVSSDEIDYLKAKVNEQESLIAELQDKLTHKDAEDIFDTTREAVENDEVISNLKLELEKVSEELKSKEEIISQLQTQKFENEEFEQLEPFTTQTSPEELEELKLANQQANNIIFTKDEEIQELKDLLEKEKQKSIQLAGQKAEEAQVSSGPDQYYTGSAAGDKDMLKAYKEQIEHSMAKIRELEWQNDQMAKQITDTMADKPDDPDKSGGWMKKL